MGIASATHDFGTFTVTVSDLATIFPYSSWTFRISVKPRTVAFASFAAKAEIETGQFEVKGTFTLGAGSDGIAPTTETVALQVGSYSATIPAGSFKQDKHDRFKFEGMIDGVSLEVVIRPLGGASYEVKAEGKGVTIAANGAVDVSLTVGNDAGSTTAPLHDD